MTQATETTLRTQITDCTRMMVMAELLDYSGHVSARIPGTDRFLVPPRDASRAGLKADEIGGARGKLPLSRLFTMVDRPMAGIRNSGFPFTATPVLPDPPHIRAREQGDA